MRLPDDTQRHMIYGKTGSGKTVVGLWALEKRNFLSRPWFVLDFKRDPTIKRIPRLVEVDIRDKPTKHPGLYVVRPMPGDEEEVTSFLWKVWQRENTGLFIDEGYMVGRFNKALAAILTQGRSKHIPMIGLSQRPSWLSPFWMSEADFHQVMYVTRPTDVKALREWIPGWTPAQTQDYTSQYFDVSNNDLTYLRPVPSEDEILDRFDLKMPRRVRLFIGLVGNVPASRRKRDIA